MIKGIRISSQAHTIKPYLFTKLQTHPPPVNTILHLQKVQGPGKEIEVFKKGPGG